MRVTIAKRDEVAEGQRMMFAIDGKKLALFNVQGDYYCIADTCSHDDGPLADGKRDGYTIACPRHGAKFYLRDGRVLSFPAVRGIDAYPVEVVGDEITIDIN